MLHPPPVNEVPTISLNNGVQGTSLDNVNDVPTNPSNNEVDPFNGMHPAALDHLIQKRSDPYPHYRVFRKGTKYEYRTVQYERFGPEFIAEPFVDGIRTRDGTHEYHV